MEQGDCDQGSTVDTQPIIEERKLKRMYRRAKLRNRKTERMFCDALLEARDTWDIAHGLSGELDCLVSGLNKGVENVLAKEHSMLAEFAELFEDAQVTQTSGDGSNSRERDSSTAADDSSISRHSAAPGLLACEQILCREADTRNELLARKFEKEDSVKEADIVAAKKLGVRTKDSSKSLDKVAERNRKGRERSLRTRERNLQKLKSLESNCKKAEELNSGIKRLIEAVMDQQCPSTRQSILKFVLHLQDSLQTPVKASLEEFTSRLQTKAVTIS